MWLDNILEAKQRLGVSAKEIASRSKSGISERTIRRIFSRVEISPRIDTVLDIGEALGMTWHDIFDETVSVVANPVVATLPFENDALRAERDAALAEAAVLRDKVESLRAENDALKEELLSVHRYYIKRGQ